MVKVLQGIFTASFFHAIFRVTTPILFASLAALISDVCGIVNVGIEGLMLISALTGVVISALTQSAWSGMIVGVIVSALFSLLLAYFHLKLKTNIILAGIALNLMASGGTVFVLAVLTGQKGVSTALNSRVLPDIRIPFIDKIPILGEILSNHNVLTYIAFISVPLVWYFMYRMPLGLRFRTIGENPEAARSVGIHVHRLQYLALVLSGLFAGLAGVYMSMGYVSWFVRDMAAGRGFMGLAAAAMGGNKPFLVMLAALLFGIADALSNYLQSLRIPSEIVHMIPYLITVVFLTIYAIFSHHKKMKKITFSADDA
ncbi:MAG TPA: ABC transporter permease [Candidatus Pacearchaeota archaeon]|nr:ABC transporter permease [Candidatus Pacearchaeota archaeon]